MSSTGTPSGHGSEFEPAKGEQIQRIADLTGRLVDGSFTLASNRTAFHTDFFEGDFFRHWVAQYSYTTGKIEPAGPKQAKEVLDHPEIHFPELFTYDKLLGIENNGPGLLLGLSEDFGPQDRSVSLGAAAAEDRNQVGYHLVEEYTKLAKKPFINPCEAPQEATEEQVQILSNMTDLIAPFCELQPEAFLPGAVENAAARLAEQIYTFEEAKQVGLTPLVPTSETVSNFRDRVQRLLGQQSTTAKFVRRFGDNSEGSSVNLSVGQGKPGGPTVAYEIRTGAQVGTADSEVFVSTLRLNNQGVVDYAEHFDVDFEQLLQGKLQDPGFGGQDLAALVNEMRQKREESRESFADEKAEGFHEFSQADADRIISKLEAAV